jgi:hypothetical protein
MALAAVLERQAPITDAVNAAVCAILEGENSGGGNAISSNERPSERLARENAAAMELMAGMHARGQGRSAATAAGRRFAADPHDPLECEMKAQRFRRLWRQKISECRSVGNDTT